MQVPAVNVSQKDTNDHQVEQSTGTEKKFNSDPSGNDAGAELFSFTVKTGFNTLLLLFLILGIVFILSNSYWVPEGTVAVHCRFGAFSGAENKAIKAPGGPYFALPFPADKVIKLTTSIQHVLVDRAFMLEQSTDKKPDSIRLKTDFFKPGVHGSLITGDKNLVQGTWVVHYRIDFSPANQESALNVALFVKNIGTIEKANEIIRVLSEQAIIKVVGGTSVADFIAGHIDHDAIKSAIQKRADLLGTGLSIISVTATHYNPPATLENDFQAATQAESEKALQIERAMRYRVTTLSETAGERWEELLTVIGAYESAVESGDLNTQNNTFKKVEELLLSGQTGGNIASQIDKARTDKTNTIEKSRSAMSRFSELLPAYKCDAHVLKNQLFQDVLLEVWAGPLVKVRWFPAGTRLYLNDLDRDDQD
jgi:regulator of protease activity HflC (stomatin/prohibitin superfamily)